MHNADGTQWYGTSDGLYFSRAGAPAALIKEPAIAFPVTSIFDDGLGFLWLAGRTPGVVRFRIWDRQIFPYTTAEGLGDDEITRALCDRTVTCGQARRTASFALAATSWTVLPTGG